MDIETTETTGTEDFFSAFDSGDTAETEDTATEQNTTDEGIDSEDVEAAEAEETAEEETAQEDGEEAKEDAPEADKPESEQMYEITTDGKTENVTLAELKTRAQKGGAFDRVKGQNEEYRKTIQSMKEEADKNADLMAMLEFASKETGTPVDRIASDYVSAYIRSKGGSKELADEKMRNFQLSRQLAAKQEADKAAKETAENSDSKARAEADYNAFTAAFPNVSLDEALTDGVKADIRQGMSLLNAYQKHLNEVERQKLADERKQQAQEEKNRKNRRSSPGSQKTGGQAKKDPNADFFNAYE